MIKPAAVGAKPIAQTGVATMAGTLFILNGSSSFPAIYLLHT